LEGKKRPKSDAISELSALIAKTYISGTDGHEENRKSKWSTTTSPTLGEKIDKLWSINKKL